MWTAFGLRVIKSFFIFQRPSPFDLAELFISQKKVFACVYSQNLKHNSKSESWIVSQIETGSERRSSLDTHRLKN